MNGEARREMIKQMLQESSQPLTARRWPMRSM